jgi:hypothetical protein
MAEDKQSRLPVAARQTHRGSTTMVRPLNCGAGETESGRRCPRCKQFHLRPGYCQALDPINAAQYPEFHVTDKPKMPKRHRAETDGVSVTSNESNDLDVGVTLTEDDVTPIEDRECDFCGTPYRPKRSTSRYCSPGCRKKASRQEED